ncbi:hypothetical protein BV25DRAFT_1992139 [Artomyces pyxidatus]|uniref:Uncharacterized protein n=1 Tax=Artomyces pyxidatus TaxID=48021 RepID=A0ACB8SZA7_9AGAM|nr:hypothetical protein BV25DRAFT_1992139 [Artomyces pyxidatus]
MARRSTRSRRGGFVSSGFDPTTSAFPLDLLTQVFQDQDFLSEDCVEAGAKDKGETTHDRVPQTPQSDAPVLRLPFEIMNQIFANVKMLAGTTPPRRRQPPNFLAVTQVCYSWRSIAYSCKDLWTDIHLQSYMWTRISLDRSNPYPVTVRCVHDEYSDGKPPNSAAMALALRELPRIRDLALEKWHPYKRPRGPINTSAVDTLVADAIRLLTARSAPLLQELSLDTSLSTHPVSLAGIFQDDVPSALCFLKLRNCQIPSSSVLFAPTLTRLHLYDCVAWPTDEHVRETFSRMPRLQNVLVTPVKFRRPVVGIDLTLNHVHLSEARNVAFVGDVFHLAIGMRGISVSCGCDRLEVTFLPLGPGPFQRYASWAASTIQRLFTPAEADASYETVAIVQAEDNSAPQTAVFQASNPRCNSGGPGLPATLQATFRLAGQSIDIACSLLHALPSARGVRTLRACHPDLTVPLWVSIRANGDLETVIAERAAVRSLVKAFDHAAREGDFLFPQLRHLYIVDVVLGSLGDADNMCRGLVSELGRMHERGEMCKLTLVTCDVVEDVFVQMQQMLGVDQMERDDGDPGKSVWSRIESLP